MSFTVTTAPQQLPDFGETVLFVNNGTDTVFVGKRRDILPSDGFPLPPLGQLTLAAGDIYYAQANSGQQELDAIPGALSFSPSPAQIAAQIVGSTLAQAISTDIANSALPGNTAQASYTQGTRLADSSTSFIQSGGLASGAYMAGQVYQTDGNGNCSQYLGNNAVYIDARNYHSLILDCYSNVATTVTIWYVNVAGVTPIFIRQYELAPSLETVIMDNVHGPYVVLLFNNLTAGNGSLTYSFRFSNRVLPGEFMDVGGQSMSSQADEGGFLLNATGTVASSANSTTFVLPPVSGKYGITLGLGFTANFKYFYGSQNGGQQRSLPYTPAPQNVYFELPSTRKALYFFLNNTGASSSTFGIFVVNSKSN